MFNISLYLLYFYPRCPTYGSSIKVEGSLTKSAYKGQDVELIAEKWSTYGSCPSVWKLFFVVFMR